MNTINIIGRLTDVPTMRESKSENPIKIASFAIAVDRRYKREGQPEADFFDVAAFGKTAEFIEKYFIKGSPIAITGRLQQDRFTTKDGVNASRVVIMAEEVNFAGPKPEGKTTVEAPAENADDYMNLPEDDDLPF